ncbi:glycosyltransferase family 4 protein [Lentibacillus sediminis]|uniref:glycosyltransferase family 4 protein n=1 Tax=Lentibacillus sediminis TaxID=1940529 RepID=UPI000C1C0C6C|nr:glycosyltransferase family 4 protein [Lentibacillus sediminis]
MRNKVLYCATVDYHFKAFHLPSMKWFKEQGWKVDVAAAGEIDLPYTNTKYNIAIQRSPFHRSNMQAYEQLRQIINQNNYEIIHCHTPLGGVLARLAAREARKKGTKVVYTAHGFHFCKGAPFVNWLIYYPIEKYLSRHTDHLITINREDFELARKHRFKADQIEWVHGVGVDTEKFKPAAPNEKAALKKSFGYAPDDFLLFYAGEFNKNKNQQFLIQVMALVKDDLPHVKLLLAGEGALMEDCKKLAERLSINHMVEFLGFRKDIEKILPICDAAVASSHREGLPVNVMEAMATGLPVVAVNNRGHRELIHNNKTGWVLPNFDPQAFAQKITTLAKREDVRSQFGLNGRKAIIENYSITKILQETVHIYEDCMAGKEEEVWAAQ